MCVRTLNDNVPGLDGDLDPLGDLEQFLRVAAHCQFHSCLSCSRALEPRNVESHCGRSPRVRDCATQRFDHGAAKRFRDNVHVLHLGGLLWVSDSTEVARSASVGSKFVGSSFSLSEVRHALEGTLGCGPLTER